MPICNGQGLRCHHHSQVVLCHHSRMLGVLSVPLSNAKALGLLSKQDAQIAADTGSTVEV